MSEMSTENPCAVMVSERPWFIREHACPNRPRYLMGRAEAKHPKPVAYQFKMGEHKYVLNPSAVTIVYEDKAR